MGAAIQSCYQVAVGLWGIQPSEFWAMTPAEWWWLQDLKWRMQHPEALSKDDVDDLQNFAAEIDAQDKADR